MDNIKLITDEKRIRVTSLVGNLRMGRYQVFNHQKNKWETKLRMFFIKDIRIPVEEEVTRAYELRFGNEQKEIKRIQLASGLPTPIRRNAPF